MHRHRKGDKQLDLPIDEAQAAHRERRDDIYRVVHLLRGDLHLREFLIWIFNVTDGGAKGTLTKTINEISASPWGLCCGTSKAESTINKARSAGIIMVDSNFNRDGSRGPNSYSLNWSIIGKILGHSITPKAREPHHPKAPTVFQVTSPESQGTSPVKQGTSPVFQGLYKEYSPLTPLFKDKEDDDVVEKYSWEEFNWEDSCQLAIEVDSILFPGPHPTGRSIPFENRVFLKSCSVMALKYFDSTWLTTAARNSKNPGVRDRLRFLRGILRKKLLGKTFQGFLCEDRTLDLVWNRLYDPIEKLVRFRYSEIGKQTTVEQA
jgi:hypothetical protein